MKRRQVIPALLLACWSAPAETTSFPLRFEFLSGSLASLSTEDRKRIDTAISLIRRGEHVTALAPLLEMSKANERNSAVRVLLSYVLLQAGNLAGAFDHAVAAEKAPDHNSYVCLFLARVAAVTGNAQVCRRELKHVSRDPALRSEAAEVERQLKSTTRR